MMMEKRNFNVTNIGETGWLICTIGRFSLMVMNTGAFQIVDSKTGIKIDITEKEAADLACASGIVSEWTSGHNVIL